MSKIPVLDKLIESGDITSYYEKECEFTNKVVLVFDSGQKLTIEACTDYSDQYTHLKLSLE